MVGWHPAHYFIDTGRHMHLQLVNWWRQTETVHLHVIGIQMHVKTVGHWLSPITLATLHWWLWRHSVPTEGGQSYPSWPKLPQFTVAIFVRSAVLLICPARSVLLTRLHLVYIAFPLHSQFLIKYFKKLLIFRCLWSALQNPHIKGISQLLTADLSPFHPLFSPAQQVPRDVPVWGPADYYPDPDPDPANSPNIINGVQIYFIATAVIQLISQL